MIAGLMVFVCALAASLIVIPLASRAARAVGALDMPAARKVHDRPVPRVGGVALAAATIGVTLPAVALGGGAMPPAMTAMIAGATGVFLVGLVDDIRGVSPKLKCLGLLAAAAAVCMAGGCVRRLDLGGGWTLDLGAWGYPLTVLWIVGVTVGLNFMDGLDGLAAGIAVVAAAVLLIMALATGQAAMAVLMLALLGALAAFLAFNFNPASIFMGDCGSMFLGFTLASAAALSAATTEAFAAIALPAVALGIPIVDALLTFIRRGVLERRSIFNAERGHIHHRLISRGIDHRRSVLLIYGVTLGVTALGMMMLLTQGWSSLAVMANLTVMLLLLFHWVGSLKVGDIARALRRNAMIRRQRGQYRRHFEDVQLKLRVAAGFDQWWEHLREAAEKMEFVGMTLHLVLRNGSVRHLHWDNPHVAQPSADDQRVYVTIPVRQRRGGDPVRLEVELSGEQSLELAAGALGYFSRLLDEHSLADLARHHRPPSGPVEGGSASLAPCTDAEAPVQGPA
ncbi:MAG: undecaprenyl/decaprenyl-phosphate alpha-N-acetylglucosaminyl 1-phosphate transferase [Planctomycetes bacterium]|nr:undecaprenyl/decaprenyl-phosphate alpha-N-acetylglucosaminyl 1-phosphate transferase [Planctomycetota bacterium]